MSKSIAILICLVFVTGCGGASYRESSYAEAPQAPPAEQAYGSVTAAETVMRRDEVYADDMGEFEDVERVEGAFAPPTSGAGVKYKTKSTSSSPGSGDKHSAQKQVAGRGSEKPNDPATPMVVYTGFLRLRVKRLLAAVDEVTKITEDRGGYIESLTKRVIVVRVPALDFDEVIAAFALIGELLERRIQALDVTERFTDLGARLAVAKDARERLLKLLEKVEDVEERLRILQEIKRLSEKIESIESTLATLKNLVDYFTITIELQPVLEESGAETHRSPFQWVRGLTAHRTTIFDGADELNMKLPSDFVLFDEEDEYRAQAADTTVIRGGVVDNEPMGNNAYWSNAVHHEMEGRAEKLVEDGDSGPMTYRLYRSEDVQPRYYLVAIHTHEEDIYVVEVFYPSEDAYKAHHDAIKKTLATLRVK
ncbi:MAG: DUF4349 domain-containing protein [Deltaproteobacteria bacterium]|nr:DUF4349 domain-containing protein [Deltaproteobacteria bacterium]